MNNSLIWLHEDALRITHPVFRMAPPDTPVMFIWDDNYLRVADYSFKRLVFLYESLCELSIPIVRGETLGVLSQHPSKTVYVPTTPNPWVSGICRKLTHKEVNFVPEEPFAILKRDGEFRRFFHYWSKAERSAFLQNGGLPG